MSGMSCISRQGDFFHDNCVPDTRSYKLILDLWIKIGIIYIELATAN